MSLPRLSFLIAFFPPLPYSFPLEDFIFFPLNHLSFFPLLTKVWWICVDVEIRIIFWFLFRSFRHFFFSARLHSCKFSRSKSLTIYNKTCLFILFEYLFIVIIVEKHDRIFSNADKIIFKLYFDYTCTHTQRCAESRSFCLLKKWVLRTVGQNFLFQIFNHFKKFLDRM